jgi:hypothetical protein
MALKFFNHTKILDSPGVAELPAELILEEVMMFTIPAILKIIDNYIENGGSSLLHSHPVLLLLMV